MPVSPDAEYSEVLNKTNIVFLCVLRELCVRRIALGKRRIAQSVKTEEPEKNRRARLEGLEYTTIIQRYFWVFGHDGIAVML
jgi:hypothetical protein